jgi:hypothetical protein
VFGPAWGGGITRLLGHIFTNCVLCAAGGKRSWFYVLRVKLELSWAVYQLGVSEWVVRSFGRWLDKRKVCGQQQQQPWLSISRQQIMRKAHIHVRTTERGPTATKLSAALGKIIRSQYYMYVCVSFNLISAATLCNKKHPYLFYLLASWFLSTAQNFLGPFSLYWFATFAFYLLLGKCFCCFTVMCSLNPLPPLMYRSTFYRDVLCMFLWKLSKRVR